MNPPGAHSLEGEIIDGMILRALLGFRVLQRHTERYLTYIGVASKRIFGRKTRTNNALKTKGRVNSKGEMPLP